MPSAELDVVFRLRASGCVFAEDEAALILAAAQSPAEVESMVERRVAGAPLEYVLGWAAFCGLRIVVDPGVFIPRRRTEFLVAQALAVTSPGAVVLDLACGSGALGAAIAAQREVDLYAADLEPAAVRCARRNLLPWQGTVYEGDLYSALPPRLRGRIDVLVCNVPYVPTDEIRLLPAEARLYEPLVTLDGGSDGLAVLRRVAAEARSWLASGGHLFVEMSVEQASVAADVLREHGLTTRITADEELGATVVRGSCP